MRCLCFYIQNDINANAAHCSKPAKLKIAKVFGFCVFPVYIILNEISLTILIMLIHEYSLAVGISHTKTATDFTNNLDIYKNIENVNNNAREELESLLTLKKTPDITIATPTMCMSQ